MRKRFYSTNRRNALFAAADADANVFNLKCSAVLGVFLVICVIFNVLGVFEVDQFVMIVSSAIGLLALMIPITVYLFYDKILKNRNVLLNNPKFKFFIFFCDYVCFMVISASLSLHTILILALPPLVTAQYHDRNKMFIITMISTMILVPISVYGGFFFGAFDRNLFQDLLTEEESLSIANRISVASTKRMLELLTHYVVPRLFFVVSISYMAYGVVHRNQRMIDKQIMLSDQVNKDIEKINVMQGKTINALANIIETRDVSTGEHIARTKHYVEMLSAALCANPAFESLLTKDELEKIKNAAPLHDVGKIAISDTILLKPGKLTPEEFEIMKTHTVVGGKMIESVFQGMEDIDYLDTAKDIALYHHERWDGTGYPTGLKGDDIPLSARIMAVADVFDALVSVRVYKGAIPPEKAFDIINEESGTHFDPEIIRTFNAIKDDILFYLKTPVLN